MNEWTPKLFSSLKTYSSKQFAKDLVAGIIVAIIALPLSIALAIASGVAPEQGLYTAIVAGFFIALLGGSSVQISGPTAAFATVVAGIVAQHGMSGLALATIMAGILLIVMGALRMGTLIKFIPYTITTGFTAGIAVTIVIGQIKDFLGLKLEKAPIETTEKFVEAVKGLPTTSLHALLVGLVCLTILILWPKINKVIPGSLIAVLAGIGLVKGLDLKVNTIGDLYNISAGLPKFTAPSLSFDTIHKLFPD
ncbi:MAG: sodium-independent anion transporter, partial [Firmicutes bacterium]|nr:sodium-independent anion transporter [Bacillota bacterium]